MSDRFSRRIYLLDPRKLSPETIAVTFAKTSRSPSTFSEIAAELSEEKSAQFNEKWVVGYGHASVAEHAVLHIAMENVSRLAVETIEANRLASFTEKSTRYQNWDREAFFIPPELEQHSLRELYQNTCLKLFDYYQDCQTVLKEQFAIENPRLEEESSAGYERRLCSSALDAARYLLPAAALANVGMTINARSLEHAISKMVSSPLEEVRQLGGSIKDTTSVCLPTLLKYAGPIKYMQSTSKNFQANPTGRNKKISPKDWLSLVDHTPLGEEKILASLLYRFGGTDYESCFQKVSGLSAQQKSALFDKATQDLGPHDCLPREFEHIVYTFDIVMDQGAYYEVKRHRMMTQSSQDLGAALGYAIPRIFESSGSLKPYQRLMEEVADRWAKLAAWNPAVAAYVVPNAFNRRVLLTLNAREAFQFIKLRTAPNAHFAVRRVAARMSEEICNVHPLIGLCFKHGKEDTSRQIEESNFVQT